MKKEQLIKKIEKEHGELKRRLKYEEVLLDISSASITCLHIEDFINSALEKIGKIVGIPLVYIYEYDYIKNTLVCHYEWNDGTIFSQKGRIIDAKAIPWFMGKMHQNNTITFKDIEKYAAAGMKQAFLEQKVKSILLVPMNISTEYYGFLGLASEKKVNFNKYDVGLLQSLAHIISLCVERKQLEGQVKLRIVEKGKLDKVSNELSVANKQLMRAAKLAELGELGTAIIHELNTPLLAVKGFAQLALEQLESGSPSREYLKKIQQASQQMEEVIKNVRSFARVRKVKFEENNLNDTIKKALTLTIGHLMLENISVTQDLQTDLPRVMTDSIQIQQVFINIIMNALRALREKTEASLVIKTKANPGDKEVAVIFADNGVGISKEMQSRMFTPFVSGWQGEEGLGLGLSVSKQIIEESKGKIQFKSEIGKGTTFTITLPISKEVK